MRPNNQMVLAKPRVLSTDSVVLRGRAASTDWTGGRVFAAHLGDVRLQEPTATRRAYLRVDLLIIDEVGLERPERDTARDAHLSYKVIAPRYERHASTIITSNIDWDQWGAYLGDDVSTVAILDRLVHHGHLLRIDGPSYRAAQHQKLNAPNDDDDVRDQAATLSATAQLWVRDRGRDE